MKNFRNNFRRSRYKNHSDRKLGENAKSIKATFEVIFLYGTKQKKKTLELI